MRSDDVAVPVTQYAVMLSSSRSKVNAVAMSPSLHSRNFSTIHAASPIGESVSAYDSVCGFVPWMRW